MNQRFLSLSAEIGTAGIRRGAGGPFGAVIVRGKRVIAKAHNTVLSAKDATCHAEINAIRAASRTLRRHLLNDCVIYSSTEPCPMCFSAIHWAALKHVYYATTIADVKRLGFNELSISVGHMRRKGRSPVRLTRIENADCRRLLTEWKSLPARVTY